jgi:phosphatidylinositol-3-phosphatase
LPAARRDIMFIPMSTQRWLVTLAMAAPACSPNDSGSTLRVCDQLSTMQSAVPPKYPGTVFTIVMENHSRHEIIGNGDAPYISSLAKQFAVANGYHDAFVHPSEANYLWMVSGENFDVLDDNDPIDHHLDSTSHLVDQIEAAKLSWKSYQEGMGAPCGLASHGRYAAKHDPFVFFNDVNGWDGTQFQPSQRCIDHVVDYSALATDITNDTIPRYAFITPDLDDDMHDGSVQDGDAWLSHEIPKIMATDAYQNGGTIFLLWDEGGGYPAEDDPPFLIISPNVKPGFASEADYDTSSYLKTVEVILGIATLPCADLAERTAIPAMTDMFTSSIDSAPPFGGAASPGKAGLALAEAPVETLDTASAR